MNTSPTILAPGATQADALIWGCGNVCDKRLHLLARYTPAAFVRKFIPGDGFILPAKAKNIYVGREENAGQVPKPVGRMGGCALERVYEGMSLREVTEYLFCRDMPQKSDLIFVFGGPEPARARKAAELFHEGFAPRILVTGGGMVPGGQTEASLLHQILVDAGVPQEAILCENRSINTRENLLFGKKVLEEKGLLSDLRNVILVSMPPHMRRAWLGFQNTFPNVHAVCCPSDGDIAADNWYQNHDGQHAVFRELEKIRSGLLKGEL